MSKLAPEAAAAYAARCLRMNPMWEADEVLHARAEAHGVESAGAASAQRVREASEQSAQLRQRLYEIRDEVWKATPDKLNNSLAGLPLEGQPELQELAARLHVIVKTRSQLPALTQSKRFDGDFFDCFKQVLSGGPRESAAMRERVAASFQDKALRKRGARMIQLLRKETPELYALESEWLQWLPKQKGGGSARSVVVEGGGDEGSSYGCLWWFLIIAVIRILMALARSGEGG